MEKFENLPIGIDLGTTFSCIGVYRNSAVEIIPNEKGDRTTPSIVSFLDDQIYVGEQTEYKRLKDPRNKVYAVKRIIGRNFEDKEVKEDINKFSYVVKNNNGKPQIEINSNGIKHYSPEEISAKILAKLKQSAESFLQREIKKVVITVPAYFTERQKKATKNAGEIAGLDVIKIINEPTAASLAYGFGKFQSNKNDNFLGKNNTFENNFLNTYRSNMPTEMDDNRNNEKETQKILVFDLGGGTLDVTLLELEEDDITVKAHSGKMHLGGEDFDNILLQYFISRFKKKTRIDLNKEEYIKQKIRLKEHCIKAKIDLSYQNETDIEVESLARGKDLFDKISRAKFEELCKDLFNKCKEPILEVLSIAKEDKQNIDEIVLVGGSTRIPKIQSILEDFFNGKKLNKKLNPDEAVAYGATIEAAMEMGEYAEDITLLDVCPFSLGVGVKEDKTYNEFGLEMNKIINKGSKLPLKKTRKYHPADDPVYNNPSCVIIEVFEGENKFVKDNYPLGKFKIMNLPYMKKEDINIDIIFELDENSILTVTGKIRENNSENSLVIKNDKGGLSRKEIENAKLKHENEEIGKDLEPALALEKNYKYEINNLINKINNCFDPDIQFNSLKELENTIENFIASFNPDIEDNYIYKEKMHYYLKILFKTYSSLLNYNKTEDGEKNNIISKIKKYLKIFEKKGTSLCPSLVQIFSNNEDDIFGELCIEILGYYSQRGTELYQEKEKKYAKHYLEEALVINEIFGVEQRVKNNNALRFDLDSVLENCKELINILKAESIEKYCASFSKFNLIKEEEYSNEEQKIDILDRFKEALRYLGNPQKRADKLLKAIYLANIIKIEYKMFKSNNYDILLKMIEECINLKIEAPEGCETPDLEWFDEICNYKNEIEKKQNKLKENPKEEDKIIKENLKEIIRKIDDKFKEGKISFFFYILTNHKPNGLKDNFIFKNSEELENAYKSNKNKFMKQISRLYNPQKYKGDKLEQQKIHYIMHEISMKLNSIEN